MRKFSPTIGEYYHVFNRGTDKRAIFSSKKDYERFIVDMILFNEDENGSIKNISRYDIDSACQEISKKPLVKIHAFSLMPNHFHFILEQVAKNGISQFMHRVEMGYSKYFNKFYSRNGHLFQGTYKMVHIDSDAYYFYIPLYIHLNPLDLLVSEKNWKKKGVKNKANAINFLKTYPWSSLSEYLGGKRYPFIERGMIEDLYKGEKEWENAIEDWLPDDDCATLSVAQ